MFSEAKVGDRVFDYLHQKWGTIEAIDPNITHSVQVKLQNNEMYSYTYQGYINNNHVVPVLFWNEVKPLTPPKRPLPELRVDTKILVWDSGSCKKFKRHFSHFDEDGTPHCFLNGTTSFTGEKTEGWDYWELPKPVLE